MHSVTIGYLVFAEHQVAIILLQLRALLTHCDFLNEVVLLLAEGQLLDLEVDQFLHAPPQVLVVILLDRFVKGLHNIFKNLPNVRLLQGRRDMQGDLPEIVTHVLDLRQLRLFLMLRVILVALAFLGAVVGFVCVFVMVHFLESLYQLSAFSKLSLLNQVSD